MYFFDVTLTHLKPSTDNFYGIVRPHILFTSQYLRYEYYLFLS